MKDNNTVSVSFMKFSENHLVPRKKEYIFHIPKAIRDDVPATIKYAIINQSWTANELDLVKVNRIYREEIEETGKTYASLHAWQEVLL